MPCPECGKPGRKVSPLTVQSHTVLEHFRSLEASESWQFCRTPSCSIGYFSSPKREAVTLDAMKTTPFPKSDDPARLVCFCFEHTVEAVTEDLRKHPESTIKADIREACRGGQDDCERMNPEGLCCLGNVALVIRNAGGGSSNGSSCCGSESSSD
jgi:acetoin utilization deacetylase AcuC-like enzyme